METRRQVDFNDFVGKHIFICAMPGIDLVGTVLAIIEMKDPHDSEYTDSWMEILIKSDNVKSLDGKTMFIDINMITTICEV